MQGGIGNSNDVVIRLLLKIRETWLIAKHFAIRNRKERSAQIGNGQRIFMDDDVPHITFNI